MASKRLIKFLEENDLEDGDVIDLYNHCKWGGTASDTDDEVRAGKQLLYL